MQSVKELGIAAVAGAERFEREGVMVVLPQVAEKQGGEQSLADAGVGTGNENDVTSRRI